MRSARWVATARALDAAADPGEAGALHQRQDLRGADDILDPGFGNEAKRLLDATLDDPLAKRGHPLGVLEKAGVPELDVLPPAAARRSQRLELGDQSIEAAAAPGAADQVVGAEHAPAPAAAGAVDRVGVVVEAGEAEALRPYLAQRQREGVEVGDRRARRVVDEAAEVAVRHAAHPLRRTGPHELGERFLALAAHDRVDVRRTQHFLRQR